LLERQESEMVNRMERNLWGDGESSPAAARHSLHALDADRAQLAGRLAAPWWYHAAGGLIAAAAVVWPADPSLRWLPVLACFAAALLGQAHHRTTGFAVSWPAGPQGWVLTVVLVLAVIGLLGVSFILVNVASPVWVAVPTVAAFLVMLGGGLLHDKIYAEEIRDDVRG
jgi:predicted tellurium resistance membrane protein TerC